MITIGFKLFESPAEGKKASGSGDDKPPWEYEIRIKNSVAANLIFLNGYSKDNEPEDRIVQYLERSIPGGQYGIQFPAKEDDPPEVVERTEQRVEGYGQKFKWCANVLVVGCWNTRNNDPDVSKWVEAETDGSACGVPWKERPIEERVFILNQGPSTVNDFVAIYSPLEAGEHVKRISQLKHYKDDKNFHTYAFNMVDVIDPPEEWVKEVLTARADLFQWLEDSHRIAMYRAGFKKKGDKDDREVNPGGAATSAPAAPEQAPKDLEVEGKGDMFANVTAEDLMPPGEKKGADKPDVQTGSFL